MFNIFKIRFKFLVERYLKHKLNPDIMSLANIFQDNSYELYLVGGCIRDIFLRKTPKDYDLCTNLMPNEVVKLMKQKNITCQLQGEHFGVVAVVLHDITYEIATFRSDLNDTGNRNTNVRFGVSMFDDVLRRDFTINGLFYDINKNKVIDLVGGIKDLRKGLIRAVGNPAMRFKEDNLRKLRAIRFASRLNFKIEDVTLKAIINDPKLNVTLERIYNELVIMYNSAKHIAYLNDLLYNTALINEILTGVKIAKYEFDEDHIKSFSSWIATICKTTDSVKKILIQLKFPITICNNVEFLLKYCNADTDAIKSFDPLAFNKQWKACSINAEDILAFGNFKSYLKYLVAFKPSTNITKKFQEQGLEGKKLGETLNKHYKLKYLTAISHA